MQSRMRRTRPPTYAKTETMSRAVNNPHVVQNAMEAYKQRNWFAVNKTVSKAIGGLQSHIFGYYVDQFMYWLEREPRFNGWFYKTHEDVAEELNFPVNTIRRVKQDLIRLGLLKAQMGGHPIKEWLTVDMSRLDELIRPYVEDAIGSRRHNSNAYAHPEEDGGLGGLGFNPDIHGGLTPTFMGGYPEHSWGFNPDIHGGLINKTITNKTITNKTTIRDISGEQSPPVDILNDSYEKKEKKTVQPVDRNEEYLPFAKRLADIIRKKKRINKNSSIRAWADDFRKLVTIDLIEDDHEAKIARVNRALDWYEQNIGGKFVPDIQSGASFRQKFTNIENAIERQEQNDTYNTGTSSNQPSRGSSSSAPSKPVDSGPGPRPLLRQKFGKDLGNWVFENCFKPAKDFLSGPDGELPKNVTRAHLANQLILFYEQIQHRQRHLPPDFFKTHPAYGPTTIMNAYIRHLVEAKADWITFPKLDMLDVRHNIFNTFRREYARESDHLARDPFTGLPSSSV